MKHHILVINCGSSSLKFALIDTQERKTCLKGLAERLGQPGAVLTVKDESGKQEINLEGGGHETAMFSVLEALSARQLTQSISAVGHRVVHGGEHFKSSIRISDEVTHAIESCARLAPLHNPANLVGIRSAMNCLPDLPHVAVFDTAFHQTMPEAAFLYPIPLELYQTHGVRRYGFHGTSHRYVSQRAYQLLDLDPAQSAIITAHLGNGASACAILNGESVDTTMGLTPLEGLVMGTRSGDVDPGLFAFLADELGLGIKEITDLLNKKSGLLGLSHLSNDCRELQEAAKQGHMGAKVALEVFVHRLARQIAGLAANLPRLDALVFTGGIGENSAPIRAATLKHLAIFGFKVDEAANAACVAGQEGRITLPESPIAVVIDTDEELMIALDTLALL